MSTLPDVASAELPSDEVTFVFTDIEGSTRRWDLDRAAMEEAVRRHDRIMREAIAAFNGHVFKTTGDGFCAAFSRPDDAVAAMFAAQRALVAEDFSAVDGIRVRAAIHTGTADERDRDYFGPTVNRVARLLGIAHGGQVLISGATGDLVHGSLPAQASLRDLGEHRLKDLSRPEHVYQLVAPELTAAFPRLRSLAALPNNLPLQSTSFVGREAEIMEITKLVETNRLVTLVGSGGVGKTRTSLQVAANVLDGSGDGVWFIELAPLSNGDLIPAMVAQTMGLTLPPEGDQIEHLVRALREKHALLVFDNCEHLVEASARVIAGIVRAAPHVVTLASSRQALGIAGEVTYRMPPLTTPQAVALFVERARAADNRFALTDDNAPIIAEISRRLDGIALAIELAAARVKILSPMQVRDKLNDRFRVLTGGSRDLLPRQQTLRALIDWSYDLLAERERMLFRRLSIFVNGFTLEAATAVAGGKELDEFEVFDLVASLVDKSLVLAEPNGDTLRYRLLESTRAYAVEKLYEARERDLLASRHLRYLRDWFMEMRERREASTQTDELNAAFTTELEAVRFALDDALARTDNLAGAQLLVAIRTTWAVYGFSREGVARNEAFIAALPSDEALLLAQLSATLARLLWSRGMSAHALETAMQACAFARRSDDGPTLADALLEVAFAQLLVGNLPNAEAALNEAAALPVLSANQRSNLTQSQARLAHQSGDLDAAAHAYEQCIAQQRSLGNDRNMRVNLLNLAELEHARGQTARAIALVRETLPALRAGNDPTLCSNVLGNLAAYLIASDDVAGAIEAAREAIATLAAEPDAHMVTNALEHLALAYAVGGRWKQAAVLAFYCDGAIAELGFKREFDEQTTHDRLIALLDAKLKPDERARLAVEGAALTPEAAVALALESDETAS